MSIFKNLLLTVSICIIDYLATDDAITIKNKSEPFPSAKAGETIAFTVQPNANLAAGTYNETLKVTTDKNTTVEVAVSFTVAPKPEDAPKIIKGAGRQASIGQTGIGQTSAVRERKEYENPSDRR